ncbi:hypothetical protein HYH02_009857 [Chlamydomonas schloesseri]|uniref:Ysc84 actin-binding domain-containing protein n=1 Tax=Chlamydomonas schloesseri TaxID=2026947 RepID=A0A835TDH1_9CHLO|nr:hypothetical protein HYH02_009857 [Chlamydomonas schloesseri]|eukprot:KAG2442066.1 hypothetical protein HYH02_009857 [Chlamydomonas schloesseri]
MSSFTSVSAQGPAGDAGSGPSPGEAPPADDEHGGGGGGRGGGGHHTVLLSKGMGGSGPGGGGGGQQLSDFLRRHTAEAAATLGQLVRLGPQSGPQDRMGQPSGLLPVSALQACQALMFLRTLKGGLGLSYSHGSGFLINKLRTEMVPFIPPGSGSGSATGSAAGRGGTAAGGGGGTEGGGGGGAGGGGGEAGYATPGAAAAAGAWGGYDADGQVVPAIQWSAPAFYSVDSLSVGLTLGLEQTHSVLLLWDEATVERVKAGRAVLGTDVHVMVGQRADAEDASGDPSSGDPGGPRLVLSGVGGRRGGGGLVGGGSGGAVGSTLVPGGFELPLHLGAGGGGGGGDSSGGVTGGAAAGAEAMQSGGEHQHQHQHPRQHQPGPVHLISPAMVAGREEGGPPATATPAVAAAAGGITGKGGKTAAAAEAAQAPAGPEGYSRTSGSSGGSRAAGGGTSTSTRGGSSSSTAALPATAATAGPSTISSYTVYDGALMDFSLLGGALQPDQRHNRAVYGDNASIDDIVHGRVPPPDEFGPLYSTLRMLTCKTRKQLAAL